MRATWHRRLRPQLPPEAAKPLGIEVARIERPGPFVCEYTCRHAQHICMPASAVVVTSVRTES